MQQSRRISALMAAVLAVPLVIASAAQAQYRVDTGRVNDANNRIGSGGYNSSGEVPSPALGTAVQNYSSTNILTGNSTGLSYFHGESNVFDPNQLQVNTQTQEFDQFNAISAPVNYGQRSTGASPYLPFYSRTAFTGTPPPGAFTRTPNNVGLIPSQPIVQQPGDTRLGAVNLESPQSLVPPPGELDLPGAVDVNGNRTLTTLSPLYGQRDWRSNDSSDQFFLSNYSNTNPEALSPSDRINSITSSLPQAGTNSGNGKNTSGSNTNPTGALGNNLVDNGIAGAAAATPGTGNTFSNGQISAIPNGNARVGGQQVTNQLNTQPLGGETATNTGVTERIIDLPTPAQQSSQIAALEQRLNADSNQPLNPSASAQLYNDQVRLRDAIQKQKQQNAPGASPATPGGPNTPGVNPPGFTPPGPTSPGTNPPGNASAGSTPQSRSPLPPLMTVPPPPPKPDYKPILSGPVSGGSQEPYVITSLATGMKNPDLAKTMQSAEEQMRRGKFNQALDDYDAAERLAPNNPFTRLGRSFAELGASYYGRADEDLRRVIISEQALLAGRYDLRGFLGEDRLQFITNDLQDILKTEKTNTSAAFLLAFIEHNEGNDQQAASYLDTAQQREGNRPDGVLNLMRKVWNVPAPQH